MSAYYVFQREPERVWQVEAFNSFAARRIVRDKADMPFEEIYAVRDDLMKEGDWSRYRNSELQKIA